MNIVKTQAVEHDLECICTDLAFCNPTAVQFVVISPPRLAEPLLNPESFHRRLPLTLENQFFRKFHEGAYQKVASGIVGVEVTILTQLCSP